PPGKKKILDPSTAHQIFGRAGRPQFDKRGFVFVLAHEDDVKIARWKEKYDRIPDDTKDPGLLKAKKALKKKMPHRRENETYWSEAQFEKLRAAKPVNLSSRGGLPWRLLAYMIDASPEVDQMRKLVAKRLMDSARLEAAQRELDRMLLVLWRAGYVTLEPEPPKKADEPPPPPPPQPKSTLLPTRFDEAPPEPPKPEPYRPRFVWPTDQLPKLLLFRGVNPLYGVFLVNQLGIANRQERIQAMESVLELPRSVGHFVRVPKPDQMPPGPLATMRLDETLLRLGLATMDQLVGRPEDDEGDRRRSSFDEPPTWVLTLAEKLRLLFDYDFPGVHDLHTQPVWAAGEVLEFGGDFNKYVTSKGLQKQEGVIFRHLLRLILLVAEFKQLCPPDLAPEEWNAELDDIAARLTESCRDVDPDSTETTLLRAEEAGQEPVW
ncbi:MAG: helicase, partial [Thermoguttaceae bacterium]|nr:helicase [Thermoguttaceae bacterium]